MNMLWTAGVVAVVAGVTLAARAAAGLTASLPRRWRVHAATVALVLAALASGSVTASAVMVATACDTEDSTRVATLRTDRFGCVWWARRQGANPGGDTAYHAPGSSR